MTLSAQTTASGTSNGLQSDTGEAWIAIAAGASLNGPGGADTKVTKTVDHQVSVQSGGGSTVTFDVTAENSGGSAATGVIVSDAVPQGLAPVLSSAEVNGQPAGSEASLSGQTINAESPVSRPRRAVGFFVQRRRAE